MNYQVVEKEAFKVVGIRRITPHAGGTWGIVKTDGSIEKMQETGGKSTVFHGLCFGFDGDGNNDYMVGFVHQGEDVEGFDSFTYPKTSWLVFDAEGSINDNVLAAAWKRIYDEFLPRSEYKQADLPTIESYVAWDDAANYCKVEIHIPVHK